MSNFKLVISFLLMLTFSCFISSHTINAQNMHLGVWGKEKGTDLYWKNANLDQFTNKYKEFVSQGHYLHDVETYTKNGKRLFAGMFRKAKPSAAPSLGGAAAATGENQVGTTSGRGRGAATSGRGRGRGTAVAGSANFEKKANYLLVAKGWDFLMKKYDELIRKGFRLKDIETWSENGERYYIGVFEEGSGGQGIWGGSNWDNFVKTWHDMAKANTQLIDVETYAENGRRHYIGVYRQGPGLEQSLWAHVEWDNFGQKRDELNSKGRALVDMETYMQNGKRYYIGVFHGTKGKNTFNFRMSEKNFYNKWVDYAKKIGTHVEDFEIYNVLDFEQFAKNLKNGFEGKCTGYGYAVFKDGGMVKDGGGGYRILSQNGPPKKFNAHVVKGVHSTAKTLTAIAVMQLLRKKNLTINHKIYPYLPSDWEIGEGNGIKDITFKQLLTHTSGIKIKTRDFYNQMRGIVKTGVAGNNKKWFYSNINFTLFRVIIPHLYKPQELNNVDDMATKTAQIYVEYMKKFVFNPSGVVYAETKPGGQIAYGYDFANPTKKGKLPDDELMISGAGGFFMSAIAYNKILAAFDSGKLLPLNVVKEMKTKELGMYNDNRGVGKYGPYYLHGGSNWDGKSVMVIFNNRVSAYVQVNSKNNTYGDIKAVVIKAYDNAFII